MIAFDQPEDTVNEYIEGVLSGEIVTGKLVRLAVERHVLDLKNAHERGFKFDKDIATRACAFFPLVCRHSIGEWDGQPFHLSPWQTFVIWVLFGWRRIDTNTRRFRRAYISVARKNGKTTLLAGIALLLMFKDEPFEPAAELYVAATKEDQAKIMFREAVRMVRASPALSARSRIWKSGGERISYEAEDSFFRAIGSDSDSQDGFNPHAVLEDELHAWREKHRGLKEKLATGFGARRQPLELMITTAGDDKSQIWKEEDEHAVRTLESVVTGNIVDDALFAFPCRLDDGDDVFDEANWPKANPNYGISVKPENLRDMANQARQSPAKMNQWIRYHCNRAVAASTREISAEDWSKGAKALTITPGAYGHGGIDLGRSNDWAAIAAVFPVEAHTSSGRAVDHWEVKVKCWTVRHGAFPIDKEPFRSWVNQGLLVAHEGDQIDFTAIEQEIVDWAEDYQIGSWAYDPAYARLLADRLQNVHGLNVFSFTQAHRFYNEPCTRFVEELRAGRIWHGNDPVLEWQAGNVMFHRNTEGLVKPDKAGSREFKIDGMVATFMAFSECLFAEKQTECFYDSNTVELI